MLPLSDYGRDGAPITYKAWVCSNPDCGFNIRIDNGEVIVTYVDGSTERLALENPTTWWPIEQDYFVDDYQFRLNAPLPTRVDLKTGARGLGGFQSSIRNHQSQISSRYSDRANSHMPTAVRPTVAAARNHHADASDTASDRFSMPVGWPAAVAALYIRDRA